MIKPIQQSERLQVPSSKNFKRSEKRADSENRDNTNPELMAAQYQVGLACLLAANARIERNDALKKLAVANAQLNYRKAC